jgi:hypothetical protein
LALAAGVKIRWPAAISATGTTWPAVTATPFNCRLPAVGTLGEGDRLQGVAGVHIARSRSRRRPGLLAVSSLVVSVRSLAVGASFTAVTLAVRV